jgi:two-component system, cell cycle response regulator DivK
MAGEPILVVDDNRANSDLLTFLLETAGYQVRAAADATEALKIIETFVPRVIMMDLQLPGMDGLTLTRKLKADPRTRDIIIIALTAYAMKGDDERAREAGCDGYVSKPIDTRALPLIVADVLRAQDATGGQT